MFFLYLTHFIIFGSFRGQEVCFQYEHCGCPRSNDIYQIMISNYDIQEGIKFYNGTSQKDYDKARYIILLPCCTTKECNILDADLGITALKSDEKERIQKLDLSVCVEKDEIWKEFCHSLYSNLHDPRVSKEQILNLIKNDYCKRWTNGRNCNRLQY